VAHWDGNKTNNTVSNLRWATKAENAADKHRHGTTVCGDRHWTRRMPERTLCGSQNPASKLTENQAMAIYRASASNRAIARRYGVSDVLVGRIKRGKSWKHLSAPA
jgi:hypothetical protein